MKKTVYLVLAVFLFSIAAHAQIEKGKILLGGTIGYGQAKSKNTFGYNYIPSNQSVLTLSPAIGTAIRENLVLGIQANIATQNQEYENPVGKSKYENYGGSLFLRRYVPLGKRFYFFGQAAAEYNQSRLTQTNINQAYTKGKGWGINASLYPGLAYAITKKFYAEAGFNNLAAIGYSQSNVESTPVSDPAAGTTATSKSHSFGFSTSLAGSSGFTIGFRLLL